MGGHGGLVEERATVWFEADREEGSEHVALRLASEGGRLPRGEGVEVDDGKEELGARRCFVLHADPLANGA